MQGRHAYVVVTLLVEGINSLGLQQIGMDGQSTKKLVAKACKIFHVLGVQNHSLIEP